ncbi:hypothetical protein JHK87_050673 [Glycine soja]|nr:hypothetical protein JHK87_050673 [Glycine soja]
MENWEQQYMGFGEEDPVLWLFVCGRKKLSFKSYTCVIDFKLGGLCEYADYDYLIKLLIGNNSVGKSCLLLRFFDGSFTTVLSPPLDYKQQIPSQELVAKDLHGMEWKFRHIYRGFGRGATNFHIKRTNAKEAEIRDTPKNLQKYGKSTVFGMHGQFYVSFRNCKLGVEDMQGL